MRPCPVRRSSTASGPTRAFGTSPSTARAISPRCSWQGRERQYLQAFFNARVADPSAISAADFEIYVAAYSAPGAMRAGFEVYRAFDRDVRDNREALERDGKLTVPVLAVGGMTSTSGELMEEMMREVAEDVTAVRIPGSAHWVAEENPRALINAIREFTRE